MAESISGVHAEFTASTANVREEMDKGAKSVRDFASRVTQSVQQVARGRTATNSLSGSTQALREQLAQAAGSARGFAAAMQFAGEKGSGQVQGLMKVLTGLVAGGFTPVALAVGVATAATSLWEHGQKAAADAAAAHTAKLKEQREQFAALVAAAERAELGKAQGLVDKGVIEKSAEIEDAQIRLDRARKDKAQALREAGGNIGYAYKEAKQREIAAEAELNRLLAERELLLRRISAETPDRPPVTRDLEYQKQRNEEVRKALHPGFVEPTTKEPDPIVYPEGKSVEQIAAEFNARYDALQQVALAARQKLAAATRGDLEDDREAVKEKFDLLEEAANREITDTRELTATLATLQQARADELSAIDAKAASEADAKKKVADDKLLAEQARVTERYTDAVRALNVDIAAFGKSGSEIEIAELRGRYAELIEDRKKYGQDVVELERDLEERIRQIRNDAERQRRDRAEALQKSIDAADTTFRGGFSAGLAKKLEDDILTIGQIGASVAANLAEGFSGAFADFATGAKSAKAAFASFAADFLRRIAQMIAQQAALTALQAGANAIGLSFGGFDASAGSSTIGGGGGKFPFLPATASAKRSMAVAPVHIHNLPGQTAKAAMVQGANGPEMHAVIEDVVAGSIERGGKAGRAFERSYGVQRRGRRQ